MKIKALVSLKNIYESKIKLEKQFLKKDVYFLKAKEIWEVIDRDFSISTAIESILKLKLDKFEHMLTSKFPELTSKEVEKIKQSLTRDFEFGKLYEINNNLIKENQKLKEELSKIKNGVSENLENS